MPFPPSCRLSRCGQHKLANNSDPNAAHLAPLPGHQKVAKRVGRQRTSLLRLRARTSKTSLLERVGTPRRLQSRESPPTKTMHGEARLTPQNSRQSSTTDTTELTATALLFLK